MNLNKVKLKVCVCELTIQIHLLEYENSVHEINKCVCNHVQSHKHHVDF